MESESGFNGIMTDDARSQDSFQKRVYILAFATATGLISVDVLADFFEDQTATHIIIESIMSVIAISACYFLMKKAIGFGQKLNVEELVSIQAREEAKVWRSKNRSLMSGLTAAIDAQFEKWNLSKAEKDVAYFLLKGFSAREISDLRKSAEKTVKQQCANIYKKSGLTGRSELSAFFLEDLLDRVGQNDYSNEDEVT